MDSFRDVDCDLQPYKESGYGGWTVFAPASPVMAYFAWMTNEKLNDNSKGRSVPSETGRIIPIHTANPAEYLSDQCPAEWAGSMVEGMERI